MGDIQKRLDNVRQMIQSQDFLEGKGLSNEVNIRIFCYEPRDEMAVRHFIEQLSTDKIDYLEQEIEFLKKIMSGKRTGKQG